MRAKHQNINSGTHLKKQLKFLVQNSFFCMGMFVFERETERNREKED